MTKTILAEKLLKTNPIQLQSTNYNSQKDYFNLRRLWNIRSYDRAYIREGELFDIKHTITEDHKRFPRIQSYINSHFSGENVNVGLPIQENSDILFIDFDLNDPFPTLNAILEHYKMDYAIIGWNEESGHLHAFFSLTSNISLNGRSDFETEVQNWLVSENILSNYDSKKVEISLKTLRLPFAKGYTRWIDFNGNSIHNLKQFGLALEYAPKNTPRGGLRSLAGKAVSRKINNKKVENAAFKTEIDLYHGEGERFDTYLRIANHTLNIHGQYMANYNDFTNMIEKYKINGTIDVEQAKKTWKKVQKTYKPLDSYYESTKTKSDYRNTINEKLNPVNEYLLKTTLKAYARDIESNYKPYVYAEEKQLDQYKVLFEELLSKSIFDSHRTDYEFDSVKSLSQKAAISRTFLVKLAKEKGITDIFNKIDVLEDLKIIQLEYVNVNGKRISHAHIGTSTLPRFCKHYTVNLSSIEKAYDKAVKHYASALSIINNQYTLVINNGPADNIKTLWNPTGKSIRPNDQFILSFISNNKLRRKSTMIEKIIRKLKRYKKTITTKNFNIFSLCSSSYIQRKFVSRAIQPKQLNQQQKPRAGPLIHPKSA